MESFLVSANTPTNATIARANALVSIVDNDTVVATPKLYIRDAIVDEKAGTVNVPVILGGPASQASNNTITVHYATANGTATAGSDYTATSGTLTFAPGDTVKNIPVAITDDATPEPSERFTINLSAPTNSTIEEAVGTVVIGPSDATPVASPLISVGPDVVVGEDVGTVDVPVTLSAPGLSTVTVNFTTVDVSASHFSDYSAASGTLTFAPGETTKTIRIEITDDTTPEGLEAFQTALSAPFNATITRPTGTTAIIDDDNGLNVYSLGIGNDVYSVVKTSDLIAESPDGGTDSVAAPVTYTLPGNVENLVLTGSAVINGTGNGANNVLAGNGVANKLSGLGGNDTLSGGAGNDTLIGGAGNDTLTGGAGSDIFTFSSLVGADTVSDFAGGVDKLNVSQAGIPIGNGDTHVDAAETHAGPGGFSKSAELVIFTSNISGAITTATAAAKIGSATSAYATGDLRLFVVDNGTQTAIFRFRSSSANGAVTASELTLVATVNAPSTTVSDYTFGP